MFSESSQECQINMQTNNLGSPYLQELHNKELELSRVQHEQRIQKELLQIKKEELDAREMVLLELELRIIMNPTPEPNKRKGKFSKTRLKVSVVLNIC